MPDGVPGQARDRGLWTAAWLGAFLVVGLLWVGDLSLQWPVLLVPVFWALVAMRRPGSGDPGSTRPEGGS